MHSKSLCIISDNAQHKVLHGEVGVVTMRKLCKPLCIVAQSQFFGFDTVIARREKLDSFMSLVIIGVH